DCAADALDVHRHRAPETPVGGAPFGDVGGVDTVGIVLRELVTVQEVEDVALVLLVEREDLQLREEQVTERDRPPGDGEPPLERPHVTHLEAPDEDVDAPLVLQIVEKQAAMTVQSVELMVA